MTLSNAGVAALLCGLFCSAAALPALARQTPPAPAASAASESPYEKIVRNAEARRGVFTVYHAKDGRWYFEVPKAALDRDMLWHVEAARVPADFPAGTGKELSVSLVRWVRRGDRLYVNGYNASVQKRADLPTVGGAPAAQQAGGSARESKRDPLTLSLAESGEPETLFAFPVVAESPAGNAVVDVSATFLTEQADLKMSAVLTEGGLPGGMLDPTRSYVTYLRSFPRNVEAAVHLTYNVLGKRTASFEIHHSLTLLPEVPMKPRLYDDRVGYFTAEFQDYSGINTIGVESKAFISRYRLEKKDPKAALSEPVKPIVYYISREVPDRWRPYFRQAVEDWNVAFEAAGFRNAIVARDAPSPAEDPDWDPADTRYSVIRWVSTPVANAMGPRIHDPRSGEILSAHVLIWANVVSLAETWYYTMCAGTDPRARTLPMSDEVVGRLLRYAVAHEVGHSLGLRHNHRASTAYTVAQLRDRDFAAKHGSTASIMAYGRMNYVAQPEDGLAPESLMPRVGPYDVHAIAWGHTPIPDARTPQDEFPTLDAWAAKAVENPWLAWSGDVFAQLDPRIVFDPRVLTQNVGAERVEATRLGLRNLERALGYLPAASLRKGRDFKYAATFYNALLDAWGTQLASVVREIGGLEATPTLAGRGTQQFRRVSRARQKEALRFVLENAMRRPTALMPASLFDDIQPYGLVDPVLAQQEALLGEMLAPEKAGVMHDAALFADPDRYPYLEYAGDLARGLFEEADAERPAIDPLRRSLQRRFLLLLADRMDDPSATKAVRDALVGAGFPGYYVTTIDPYVSDFRPAWRQALGELAGRLTRAEGAAGDAETRAHLTECQSLVQRALAAEPKP